MVNIPGGVDPAKTPPIKQNQNQAVHRPIESVSEEKQRHFKDAQREASAKGTKKESTGFIQEKKGDVSIFDIASEPKAVEPKVVIPASLEEGFIVEGEPMTPNPITPKPVSPKPLITPQLGPEVKLSPEVKTSANAEVSVEPAITTPSDKPRPLVVDAEPKPIIPDDTTGIDKLTPKKTTEKDFTVLLDDEDVEAPPPSGVLQPLIPKEIAGPLTVAVDTSAEQAAKALDARVNLIKVIDQLSSHLATVTTTDKVDTQITLRYPPIFEGVTLVVTQYQNAPNQFNLTFYNLTSPDARLLIESKANQETLRSLLVSKGYTLQMVTIEPKLDITISALNPSEINTYTSRQDQKQQEGDIGKKRPK